MKSDHRTLLPGSSSEERVPWQVQTLIGHAGVVYSVGFSPHAKWIVSGSEDKLVKIWDADTGAQVSSHGRFTL